MSERYTMEFQYQADEDVEQLTDYGLERRIVGLMAVGWRLPLLDEYVLWAVRCFTEAGARVVKTTRRWEEESDGRGAESAGERSDPGIPGEEPE